MKADFINPFIESMSNVLSIMANTQITTGALQIKKSERATGNVTGIIDLESERAKGSLAISFKADTIFQISENMMGESFSQLDDAINDVVGELTNMVSGGAKRILSERNYDFDMRTPEVISGKNHYIVHNAEAPTILIPLSSCSGEFDIEVCLISEE